jgi:putative two-component system response regulator
MIKGKTKILIVEDELQLMCLMVRVLTRIGCDVEAAFTGKKAMELATAQKFDLITLDISLPDADGFSLCSELKQRHISRNTPVIFISASQCEQDITEGMKRGAIDYISKPFDVTDFVYRIIFHAKAKADHPTNFQTEAATI